MTSFLLILRDEHRARPWMLKGLTLTGACAFGTALPDLIDLAHRVLG